MQYTKRDLGAYNLHIIKTNKYKTVTVKVFFRRKIEKEEITKRNILTGVLLQSTKKYDTKRKMTIEAQELYSAGLSINNQRLGSYLITGITLNVLNDKYTEKGNLAKSLDYLNEVLFNPDIELSAFKDKNVDVIKTRTLTELNSLKEDLSTYSTLRAAESFDLTSPISYRMTGYKEDLELIDGKSLYKYYRDMLEKDIVDICVIGDIDETSFVNQIKKIFKLRRLKKIKDDYELEVKKPRKRKLLAKETIPAQQSQLDIICRLGKLNDFEKQYVLPVFNVIYGGGADSKLFKIVREKHSLCYTIYSRPKALDNILMIKTGINKVHQKEAVTLIEKILKDMQKGKITPEEINVAKEIIETSLDALEESPAAVIRKYMGIAYLKEEETEERRKKFARVTKADIVKLAKKVYVDTIFTLEGDKDEETGI